MKSLKIAQKNVEGIAILKSRPPKVSLQCILVSFTIPAESASYVEELPGAVASTLGSYVER